MNIVICTAKDQDDWRDALAACMPEANVYSGINAPSCKYAVLWKPPPEFFSRQPNLTAMFSLGAGVDGLLAMPSLPTDVPLVRIEDCGMAEQMIEYAMYVALRELRGFRAYAQAQAETRWERGGLRVRGDYSIGLLGLGVLGGAVAKALADFGFAVSGWSRSQHSIDGVRCEHGADGLDRVLAGSQLLMLFLPLTDATRNLMNRERLAQLPAGAAVANLSRGELIDDEALLAALDDERLSAAYLDVFRQEPLPPEHRYWKHANVHMTPHIAALTPHSIACHQVAEKIRRLESGQPISGIVDRVREY